MDVPSLFGSVRAADVGACRTIVEEHGVGVLNTRFVSTPFVGRTPIVALPCFFLPNIEEEYEEGERVGADRFILNRQAFNILLIYLHEFLLSFLIPSLHDA